MRISAGEVSAFVKENDDEIQPQTRFFRGLCHTVRRVWNRRIFLFSLFCRGCAGIFQSGGRRDEGNQRRRHHSHRHVYERYRCRGGQIDPLNANVRNDTSFSAGSPSAWAIKDRSTVSVPTAKGETAIRLPRYSGAICASNGRVTVEAETGGNAIPGGCQDTEYTIWAENNGEVTVRNEAGNNILSPGGIRLDKNSTVELTAVSGSNRPTTGGAPENASRAARGVLRPLCRGSGVFCFFRRSPRRPRLPEEPAA